MTVATSDVTVRTRLVGIYGTFMYNRYATNSGIKIKCTNSCIMYLSPLDRQYHRREARALLARKFSNRCLMLA
jgi:hypothetical protein